MAIRLFQSNILNHDCLDKNLISAIRYRKKEILLTPLTKYHDWVSYSVFLSSKEL